MNKDLKGVALPSFLSHLLGCTILFLHYKCRCNALQMWSIFHLQYIVILNLQPSLALHVFDFILGSAVETNRTSARRNSLLGEGEKYKFLVGRIFHEEKTTQLFRMMTGFIKAQTREFFIQDMSERKAPNHSKSLWYGFS